MAVTQEIFEKLEILTDAQSTMLPAHRAEAAGKGDRG